MCLSWLNMIAELGHSQPQNPDPICLKTSALYGMHADPVRSLFSRQYRYALQSTNYLVAVKPVPWGTCSAWGSRAGCTL